MPDKDMKDIFAGIGVVLVLLSFLFLTTTCAKNEANQTTKRMELCVTAGKTWYSGSCI